MTRDTRDTRDTPPEYYYLEAIAVYPDRRVKYVYHYSHAITLPGGSHTVYNENAGSSILQTSQSPQNPHTPVKEEPTNVVDLCSDSSEESHVDPPTRRSKRRTRKREAEGWQRRWLRF